MLWYLQKKAEVAKMQSLSSRGTSELSWLQESDESEESEESELWSILGMGPAVQVLFCWLSTFWATCCWWTSSLHPGQHCGGYLDILTSLVIQSISGLCLQSQECPRINFCLPKLLVLSKWFLEWRIKLTTSIIEPASLGVPSTLYMGISHENLTRLKWLLLAKELSSCSAIHKKCNGFFLHCNLWFQFRLLILMKWVFPPLLL